MKSSKIVFFSDLHYAPEKPINNGSKIDRKLTEYSLPLLNALIDKINNKIKPDLVINLGDIIEDFNDHDKDIENLAFIKNKFNRINCPFYTCIGNHDLRTMSSRKEVEEIFNYNHSTFSFDLNNLHFIILGTEIDSTIGTAEGGIFKTQFISKEDLEWLKKDLKNNSFPTIICLHFGVAEDDMKGNWWFETIPETALLGNRKDLKEIINNNKNILAVFSGHQHWTKMIIENNIPYYIIGSLTENMNNDGIPDGVYYVATYQNNSLNVVKHHISL